MNKDLNEIIEMFKLDRDYYRQCMLSAFDYASSDALITYYSNILMYIDSLIPRINALIKERSD